MTIKDKKILKKLADYGVLNAKDVESERYSKDEPNIISDGFGNLQKVDAEGVTKEELDLLLAVKQLDEVKKANNKLTFLVVVGIVYLIPIVLMLLQSLFQNLYAMIKVKLSNCAAHICWTNE